MRLPVLLTALLPALILARTAEIFIQPISALPAPAAPLASITYDTSSLDPPSITSYEAPDLPDDTTLVRIGLYDTKSLSWISGTTVASTENFAKGYAPTVLLSVDVRGDVLSATVRGVAIDAGHTRDFGPSVVVLPELRSKGPELNKPVVLSPEGRKVDEPVEKSLLQKYWWLIAVVMFLAVSGGGSSDK